MKLNIPKSLTAGDRTLWRDRFNDYLPNTHTLTYSLRGNASIDVTSVDDNGEFLTIIENAASSTLTPGNYYWQATITEIATNYRSTLGNGHLEAIVDLSTVAGNFDGRSNTQKTLDAVESAILAHANGGLVQSYSIKGRSLSKYSLTELIQLRDRLRTEVSRIEAARDGSDGRRAYVRFDRPI